MGHVAETGLGFCRLWGMTAVWKQRKRHRRIWSTMWGRAQRRQLASYLDCVLQLMWKQTLSAEVSQYTFIMHFPVPYAEGWNSAPQNLNLWPYSLFATGENISILLYVILACRQLVHSVIVLNAKACDCWCHSAGFSWYCHFQEAAYNTKWHTAKFVFKKTLNNLND